MKKILSIIICICILAFSLVACCDSNTAEATAKVEEYNRFEVIDYDIYLPNVKDASSRFEYDSAYMLVDRETGVCYLYIREYRQGGITVMLDADGKPLLWSGG